MSNRVIEHVVWQHAEETALLWLRHENAVGAPHFALNDLAQHDELLTAHLEGLRIAGPTGWTICLNELRWREPGAVFAATMMALDEAYSQRIGPVFDVALQTRELARAVVAAFGWSPYAAVADTIEGLANATHADTAWIGLAAATAHRQVTEQALCRALERTDPNLHSRAMRAVGQMGYVDLISRVAENAASINTESAESAERSCAIEAAWTCALRAKADWALNVLKNVSAGNNREAERAVRLLAHVLDFEDILDHLRFLANDANRTRLAVIGAGVLGAAELVDWLIELFDVAELARVAGEAFTMITGLALDQRPFEGVWPEGFEAGPSEDPADEDVAMDPDENLPWPCRQAITRWWVKRREDFTPATRYLLGRPIDEPWCEVVLRSGYQRQRSSAATELAVRRPRAPLFEIRAPAMRQKRLLELA